MQPGIDPASAKLAGVNVLLEGATGVGKTFSIATCVEAAAEMGMEAFYLALEPGMESLLAYWTDKGKPIPDNLHWHYLKPATADFATLLKGAESVNQFALDQLAKMQDPNRTKYNEFIHLLQCFNSFVDQRTGENFGAVDEWGVDRILIVDPMTGINNAAMSLVVGSKPVRSQADWGIAQDQVEKLLRMLTNGCRCHFVLTAHVEREIDQVLGGTKITISTLGKALAPKIPPMFSDVIYAYRDGTNFFWSTANSQVDLKTRNLPLADKLQPTFKPILEKWRSRAY